MVIVDLAPVKSRAAFVGMIMGISGLGSMAGPAMGGGVRPWGVLSCSTRRGDG
jgi:hypothetical protein